jgi:hypothetical protein
VFFILWSVLPNDYDQILHFDYLWMREIADARLAEMKNQQRRR